MSSYFKTAQFAADILEKRNREDISLPGASKQSGVSVNAIWRAESKKIPSLEIYAMLCRWLGKPVETYFIILNNSKSKKDAKPESKPKPKPAAKAGKPAPAKQKPTAKPKPTTAKKDHSGNSNGRTGGKSSDSAGRNKPGRQRSVPAGPVGYEVAPDDSVSGGANDPAND